MKTIGQRIKERREELGLTQIQLARRMGYVSKSTICKIEKAGDNITTDRLHAFATALECTSAYLMGWDVDNDKAAPSDPYNFWKIAQKNAEFMEYVTMLFYLPHDRQQFIYTTISAQDRDFRDVEENFSNA